MLVLVYWVCGRRGFPCRTKVLINVKGAENGCRMVHSRTRRGQLTGAIFDTLRYRPLTDQRRRYIFNEILTVGKAPIAYQLGNHNVIITAKNAGLGH